MVTIPSDSFFFSQYISNRIAINDVKESEVLYAIRQDIKKAIEYRFSTTETHSNEWFYLAKKLAETDRNIAYDLATIYHIEEDMSQARFWYHKAALLKHKKALTELIDLYLAADELLLAKDLLLSLQDDNNLIEPLVEIAIALGDMQLLNKLISSINIKTNYQLVNDVYKYKIDYFQRHKNFGKMNSVQQSPTKKNIVKTQDWSGEVKACSNSIQLFATNLNNLRKLDRLINQVKLHPITQYLCFEVPRYIPIEHLNCNFEEDKAIRCDDIIWSWFTPEISTRYIGLMLNRGGANVDNGIMYLDAFDDKNVFIHELSHFLGFVDEYALPKNHKACQQPQKTNFSYNVSVLKPFYKGSKEEVLSIIEKQIPWFALINKDTPILKKIGDKWQVGTPQHYSNNNKQSIGLFKAETCNTKNVQAFKPIPKKTNLQYYEQPFIPLYVELLKLKPEHYLMPSYHYNIAKSLIKNNQEKLGLQWLNKALKRESVKEIFKNSPQHHRYKKMILGEY